MEAVPLLREYVAKQASLCVALLEGYPFENTTLLLDLARHGSVSLDDSYWEFQKHGIGVLFRCVPSGEVVDVPIGLVKYPNAVDAWRFLNHLESREITKLRHGAHEYGATEERSLETLFHQLRDEGIMNAVAGENGLYTLGQG
jgi:hypothetical protein